MRGSDGVNRFGTRNPGSYKPPDWIHARLVRSRAMARTAPDAATFGAAIAEAYATKGAAIELGTGNARRGARPRRGRPPPACDDEPPRSDRGCDRNREDAERCRSSPSSSPQRACRCSPPTSRAMSREWPFPARPTAPRRSARPSSVCRSRPPDSRSSTSRSAASARACRCARPCPTSARCFSRRCWARTRRRSRASGSSSTTPTRRASRSSTSRTSGRC